MKKELKILTFVLLAFIVCENTTLASSIKLMINNTYVKTTISPYQANGSVLVPLRVISDNLDAKLDWNQKTRTITIIKGNKNIVLTIGSKNALVNGKNKALNLAPQIKSSTTMVPIRFISENLDCRVLWENNTVKIITANGEQLNNKIPIDTPSNNTSSNTTSNLNEKEELAKIDTNKNGKITIKEAKAAGYKMPIYSTHWLYKYMDDRDGDGVIGE